MKKLFFILLLLLCTQFLLAQNKFVEYTNAFGLVLSPVDLGVGVGYDVQISLRSGIYSTLTKGEFRFDEGYIKDHIRAAVGYNFYLPNSITFISVGAAYNWYGEVQSAYNFNPGVMKQPISGEFGVGTRIDRVTTAIHIDPFKWESSVSVAYLFNYRRK